MNATCTLAPNLTYLNWPKKCVRIQHNRREFYGILRKYRIKGFLFRQQHPIYIFIADFYCHKIKLVVGVDGDVHFNDESQEHDDGRTGEMEKFGIKVIRFTNEQVLYNQDIILEQINEFVTEVASLALLGAGDRRG